MANDLNTVTMTGRLTRDAEAIGDSGAKFRIAVNGRAKVDGEWADTATFWDCAVWGPLSRSAAKLPKGQTVAVVGELLSREWTDKEGRKRESVSIRCENVRYLGGKSPESREVDDDNPDGYPF